MEDTELLLRNAMEHHGAAVYRLALCRMQSVQDAEDVYQDVFLRLLGQDAASWNEAHLRAWLLRCTVNRCCDLHRFRLRRPVLALADLPETEAEPDSGAAELWDAVARLPGWFWMALSPAAIAGCYLAAVHILKKQSVTM